MTWYAEVEAGGRVVGVHNLASAVDRADLIPISGEDYTLLGQRWDGSSFGPDAAPPKPRLRVTADKTRIWERAPGQQPEADQVAMLTGQILDTAGQPDPTATLPETLIEVPGATGSPSLILIRAMAGQVQVSTRSSWLPAIPFATEHSGKYDLATILAPYFDPVEAPVIEVLRG